MKSFFSPPLVSLCVITGQVSQKVEVCTPLLMFLFALMVTELPLIEYTNSNPRSKAICISIFFMLLVSLHPKLQFSGSVFRMMTSPYDFFVGCCWHFISVLIIIIIIKKLFWNTYIIMHSIVPFKIFISKMLCWFCADCVE